MKLKLDENLGRRCAAMLRDAGHDVTTVVEQGLASAPDHRVIDVCSGESRCLVTLDLDFGNPLVFPPDRYSGIAVLRLPGKPRPEDLTDAVLTLVGGLEREEPRGKLWIVQAGMIREYQPDKPEPE